MYRDEQNARLVRLTESALPADTIADNGLQAAAPAKGVAGRLGST